MAATYVTAATLTASLGLGTLYSSYTWVEETCQTAQDMINAFIEFDSAPVVSAGLTSNVATLVIANPALFVLGQTVTIAGCGSTYNGSRAITGTGPYTISSNNFFNATRYQYPLGYSFLQFAITASNDTQHLVKPYGSMTGPDTKTAIYANTAAINTAALMLATSIWQARMATQNGQAGIDGYSPSPYTMSASMMASIRGLLSPYLSPLSMIG
jgi:hypothetical protein